jgi:hypothetical protein
MYSYSIHGTIVRSIMFGIPSFDSPLTYLGVLLVTVGLYLALSGFGILRIEKYSTPEGSKSWGPGLILVLLGFATLFILPNYLDRTKSDNQQDISILGCQNDPNSGIVDADTQVVLTWGWNGFDSEAKRDEFISISSFIVEVDGTTQNTKDTQFTYNRLTDSVIWRLNIGKLSPGFHSVRLTRIFSQDYTDSTSTIPAGRLPPEICELTIQ